MLDQEKFLEEIKLKRKEAIKNSDKKYARDFLKHKSDYTPFLVVAGILVLLLSVLLVWRVIENPQVKLEEVSKIINENHNTYNLINQTNIDVTEEYVIKGDKEMVCIENANNKKQMICYR